MPRNSKNKADAYAGTVLASAMAGFVDDHPEPRSSEADILLKRLRAKKDDIGFARAFARVESEHLGPESVIETMMEAVEIKHGGKDRQDDDLAVLDAARRSLPTVIKAAKLAAIWNPRHDYVACLPGLEASLDSEAFFIKRMLKFMSPLGTHRDVWALRYLVKMIDSASMELARTADLARLATVTLKDETSAKADKDEIDEITDKAVSAVRGTVKRRSGPRTGVPKPAPG